MLAHPPEQKGSQLLTPLPGHTLVPGPSIFGPPGSEFDKKGTAARHVHPGGTRCSIKGHANFCDLSYSHLDPRAERGGTSFFGAAMHGRLPQAWESQPTTFVQHVFKQQSGGSRGRICSRVGDTRRRSVTSQWIRPAPYSTTATGGEGEHCKGGQPF